MQKYLHFTIYRFLTTVFYFTIFQSLHFYLQYLHLGYHFLSPSLKAATLCFALISLGRPFHSLATLYLTDFIRKFEIHAGLRRVKQFFFLRSYLKHLLFRLPHEALREKGQPPTVYMTNTWSIKQEEWVSVLFSHSMGTKKGSFYMYGGLALALQENDSLIINFYFFKGSFVCLFVWLFFAKIWPLKFI